MAVESDRLDVVLGSDAGHVPRGDLAVAEAQELAALKHVTVDCYVEIYTKGQFRLQQVECLNKQWSDIVVTHV